MKKLFAVLLTLLMVLSLPLFVMAEETATAPTTESEFLTETDGETSVEETTEPGTETEEYKIEFGFHPETLLTTLPVMGMGMLGIFLVTCVIILAVIVLSKMGKKQDEE